MPTNCYPLCILAKTEAQRKPRVATRYNLQDHTVYCGESLSRTLGQSPPLDKAQQGLSPTSLGLPDSYVPRSPEDGSQLGWCHRSFTRLDAQ